MNDCKKDLKHIKLYAYKLYIYHICPFSIQYVLTKSQRNYFTRIHLVLITYNI